METWHHPLEDAPATPPALVALGLFDGVHLGHQRLLMEVVARARRNHHLAVAVTFDPHPSVVVAPERRPRLMMTLGQRLLRFQELGLDLAWVVPFSRGFSELAPEAFLAHLQRILHPAEIHVGRAFRFGHERKGDVETLKRWGEESGCVLHAHAFRAPGGGSLSSSRIRTALDQGDVDEARELLGHPFALSGVVVEGDRRGRRLGYPTVNLEWEQEQLPAWGVYVTAVRCSHFQGTRLGLTNVGEKPTFAGRRLTVETHLPDFSDDLYGAHVEIEFLHRLRGEARFPDNEALAARIGEDVALGRAWWEQHRPESRGLVVAPIRNR